MFYPGARLFVSIIIANTPICVTIGKLHNLQKRAAAVATNSLRLPGIQTLPEPDLAWVVRRRYSRRKPEAGDVYLLIEVAESSLDYYLGEKAELYAAADIRDYWVVHLIAARIVVHRDPAESHYRSVQSVSGNQQIRPLAFPEIGLRVKSLWEE